MTQCAAIGDDKARHECTDGALRDAGLLSEESKAAAKRKAFGLQSTAPAPSKAVAAEPVSPKPSKKAANEDLEVTLAKVNRGADGKLVLTTTDGAVWHQVESGTVSATLAQGSTMKIEARSLGGYMCEPSRYVAFRCYRSK